jgi:hypothetical protein
MLVVPDRSATTRGSDRRLPRHFARGAGDGPGSARVDRAEFAVVCAAASLTMPSAHDLNRHAIAAIPKFCRERSVDAPAIGGDVDRTEAVGLAAGGILS